MKAKQDGAATCAQPEVLLMDRPDDISRPFFAYGIFRPGQLGFFQLREFVQEISDTIQIAGNLRLRDGLPIIDPEGKGLVKGSLLQFSKADAGKAYDRILELEPGHQYRWGTTSVKETTANVLYGKRPGRGSVPFEGSEWNGWDDPLFTAALDVVEETLKSQDKFEWDLKPLFRLQMAYLLLWSAIERYVSLRYHFGESVMAKIKRLADEAAFFEGLKRYVKDKRDVYRADRPGDKEVLDPELPGKSVLYYYQIRCNVTHRGKGVVRDHEQLLKSLSELLPIFRETLEAAQVDAKAQPRQGH